jgi:hypothetical protein
MIVNPFFDGEHKFFSSLDAEHFIEDKYDIDGDFRIVIKIRKIYKQPPQKKY